MKKRNRGFTLVEMLIVVAIIAVLAAIGIPAFQGNLERSKSAVCTANCRSLESVLFSAYLLGDVTEDEINAVSLNKGNEYAYKAGSYPCPSGGTINAHFENGSIAVQCSVHGGAENKWTNDSANKIWDVLSNSKYNTSIDSNAVNGNKRDELLKELEDKGINIQEMGMTSWKYTVSGNNRYFQWTTADISAMKPGDSITVIRYRMLGDYEGVYSVWKGKVGSNGTLEAYNGKADEYTDSLTQEQKKDIENVLSYYNDNCGDAPKLP